VVEIFIILFAIAAGFVAAGVTTSGYQLITNRPLSFEIPDWPALGRFLLGFALIFSGPVILMRNAIRARIIEGRPVAWLAASTVVSMSWSFVLGLFVMQIMLALRDFGS